MIVKGIIRRFGEIVNQVEQAILERFVDGGLETEPSITDRFLGMLERALKEFESRDGVMFRARTLRDRGPSAAEQTFGADFCGVLSVDLPEFQQRKGFLSQAKREGGGIEVNRTGYRAIKINFSKNKEFTRLEDQTEKMLGITPDSFITVYSQSGIYVVPACDIHALQASNVEVYGKRIGSFLKEFLLCYVGDTRLTAYDDDTFRELVKKTKSRTGIMFQLKKG